MAATREGMAGSMGQLVLLVALTLVSEADSTIKLKNSTPGRQQCGGPDQQDAAPPSWLLRLINATEEAVSRVRTLQQRLPPLEARSTLSPRKPRQSTSLFYAGLEYEKLH